MKPPLRLSFKPCIVFISYQLLTPIFSSFFLSRLAHSDKLCDRTFSNFKSTLVGGLTFMIFCNVILLVMKLIIDRYVVSLLSKLIKNYTNDTVLIKVN